MNFFTDLSLLLKYILLGLIQGVTEPLPISSSGHVLVLRSIFNIDIQGLSFEIIVNFGSLIAIIIIYRKDMIRLFVNSLEYMISRKKSAYADFRFVMLLVVATIPTGVIGLLFEDHIMNFASAVRMVGITLFITGVALWIIRNLRGWKSDNEIKISDAVIVGLAQSVALLPGISRSGATIVAAMLLGMKRETALRFSFLLYIPVSFGVTLLSISDIMKENQLNIMLIPYLLALITSIIATYFALKWFMNVMTKGKLKYFSYYCFIASIIIIFLL